MKQTTDLDSPYNFLYTQRGLNRNKRIYGGEQATAGTIPWIVTFVFGDPTDSLARCGGSIIGPNFVVTVRDPRIRTGRGIRAGDIIRYNLYPR